MLSVRLVPFRISIRDLIPFSGRARRGFSIREVARSNLVQPSPAGPARPGLRAPGAQPPPMRPHLSSLSHLDLPRNNFPLPLPPLSPRGALGFGDGDHRIWTPR